MSLDGVIQEPVAAYMVDGAAGTISFSTAPGSDSKIFITWYAQGASTDEVIGGIITIASTAPVSPHVGDVWVDTT